MPQLYAQLASRPGPWLLGRTSAGLCTLQTACPLTVTYSGGSPSADTIAAGSAATVYGGSAATFDASTDVWVVLTVPGSGALQVTKEADLATVVGDWAGLARVVQHSTEPYQPQAYLAAGGTGSAPTSTQVAALSLVSARAKSLWTGSANSAPPAGWTTLAFDDSAWGTAVVGYDELTLGLVPIGASHIIWTSNPGLALPEQSLFRTHFTLPAGTIVAASLLITFDAHDDGLALNGTSLGTPQSSALWSTSYPDAAANAATVAVPPSILVAGGANVLAVWVANNADLGDTDGGVTYQLSVTYAGGGAVPAPGSPSEGDILYYHNGAWTDLPIGTSGQELTVVSGDPAWATPAAGYTLPTASSSTLGGVKVGSGLSISAGVLSATSGGSVTSVALSAPGTFTVSGSPVTSSGTLTLAWASQTANTVLAAPNGSSGAPTFRVLVAGDIPSLPASQITSGQLSQARGGTGLDTSAATDGQLLIGQSSDHTFGLATLTAGTGITVTNAGHTITIASSGGGSGTVTSVALTVPSFLSAAGSPITSSGTLAVTLATQASATVFAGPASGSAAAPTFRALAASDLPAAASAGGHIHAHGHFL